MWIVSPKLGVLLRFLGEKLVDSLVFPGPFLFGGERNPQTKRAEPTIQNQPTIANQLLYIPVFWCLKPIICQ